MNTNRLPNPVWVKRGAVQPRNYNVSKHTSEDNQESYRRIAARHGKTIGDLLAECKLEELRRKLIYAK